jgi:hypothetical protein
MAGGRHSAQRKLGIWPHFVFGFMY